MELDGAFQKFGRSASECNSVVGVAMVFERLFVFPKLIHKKEVRIFAGAVNVVGQATYLRSGRLSHTLEQPVQLRGAVLTRSHGSD